MLSCSSGASTRYGEALKARLDLFDPDDNWTGYGVRQPDGSVDLFRPNGSRLGTIQPSPSG